jgi:hypothetical protein
VFSLLLLIPVVVVAQRRRRTKLVFAFELRALVAPPLVVGDSRCRHASASCRLRADRSRGRVQGQGRAGGADWQIIRPDGFSELDTRYTLETDTGKTVYVQNARMRHAAPDVMKQLLAGQQVDPALVYFRTVPKFETAAPNCSG